MNILIDACLQTLNKTEFLITGLNDSNYSNKSVPPYYSSIGAHIRHILDFYNCIVSVDEYGVDLTKRIRNIDVEVNRQTALDYLFELKEKLINMNLHEDKLLAVTDDLGNGALKINYTWGSLLAQANSHTIHHYAIINYITERLEIPIKDERFGFNATTPN